MKPHKVKMHVIIQDASWWRRSMHDPSAGGLIMTVFYYPDDDAKAARSFQKNGSLAVA